MLELLNTGIHILLWSTILFFLILFYVASMWAKGHPERNFTIGFLVSSYFTFRFFVRTFLILLMISIFWEIKGNISNFINFPLF